MRLTTVCFFFPVLYIACGGFTEEELWTRVEQTKANSNWDSTMQVSQRILKEYPQGRYSGWAQFALAESHRFKGNHREALDNYKLFIEKYPAMQPGAVSLFLVGYIYGNNLLVYDSAKIFYEQFLMKYPSHDLAQTVLLELQTLGKSPQEVLDAQERALQRMTKK